MAQSEAIPQSMASFETVAEYRLLDGWAPRFQGAQDPDQEQAWPYAGGFETPWEPASAYLADQGLALNGPGGKSEVVIWRGLEWRHYRFDAPLASARLSPHKGNRLLITLMLAPDRFETRLLEVPEGRVLWATDSGPWSRFSWDGQAVLLGLKPPPPETTLLLATLPVEAAVPEPTLAPWNEQGLPPAPRAVATKAESLWDDGKDLPGARLMVPWQTGAKLWFPRHDRLWLSSGALWTLWELRAGLWQRAETGPGSLYAQPPLRMGLNLPAKKPDEALRKFSPLESATWESLPAEAPPAWPPYDPAWAWWSPELAVTAWDQRWGAATGTLPPERQREALQKAFRPAWRDAYGLRASVRGWVPEGPEVALREASGVAWAWVGDRVLQVRLQPTSRLKAVHTALR